MTAARFSATNPGMRALRLFLRDRISAAALAAVLVQLMLLQAVAGGQACLDMAFAGAQAVLCSGYPVPDDQVSVAGGQRGDGSEHCSDCPCATLCGSAAPLVATFGSDAWPVVFADATTTAGLSFPGDTHRSRAFARAELRQRGPPHLSA